jgi:GT2 family glycosyltransferase
MNTNQGPARVTAVVCAHNPPPIWKTVVCRLAAHGLRTIVVDDASHPALAIPTTCSPSVELLTSLSNIGLAAARNKALQHVDKEWVLFVDADVLPDDAFLARLLDVLTGSQADGVGFSVREHHRQSDWDFYRACERDAFNNVQGRAEWVSGLLCAYRADTLRAVNGFDPTFRTNGEDVDVGYRLTRVGKSLVRLPEVCGEHYRKDSIGSFLRMQYRYAFTAKRVDRSLYFPSPEIGRSPPLFRLRSVWPQIRLMLQFLARRPYAFYLPALILCTMFSGACAGRKEVSRRLIRRY